MIHIEKIDSNGNPVPVPAPLVSVGARNKQVLYCADPSLVPAKSHYNTLTNNNALKLIYNNKCGYCEQEIIWFNVSGTTRPQDSNSIEHYRPKASHKYNWLAYSWDNLFLACVGCNNPKDNDFPVVGTRILAARLGDINKIHGLALEYYFIECPKYPHPEINYPENFLKYNINGEVSPNASIPNHDADYAYFITKCNLNREELKTARKKVYVEEFRDKYKAIVNSNRRKTKKDDDVKRLVRNFITASKDKTKPFLGFRRYVIKYILFNDMMQISRGLA